RLRQNESIKPEQHGQDSGKSSVFQYRSIGQFSNAAEAYHQLILDLVALQQQSTRMIMERTAVKKIFVDGGFSKNAIYMNLLSAAFPDIEVYAAGMAQATALGTAMSIHKHWNKKPLANDIIELKYYSVK